MKTCNINFEQIKSIWYQIINEDFLLTNQRVYHICKQVLESMRRQIRLLANKEEFIDCAAHIEEWSKIMVYLLEKSQKDFFKEKEIETSIERENLLQKCEKNEKILYELQESFASQQKKYTAEIEELNIQINTLIQERSDLREELNNKMQEERKFY